MENLIERQRVPEKDPRFVDPTTLGVPWVVGMPLAGGFVSDGGFSVAGQGMRVGEVVGADGDAVGVPHVYVHVFAHVDVLVHDLHTDTHSSRSSPTHARFLLAVRDGQVDLHDGATQDAIVRWAVGNDPRWVAWSRLQGPIGPGATWSRSGATGEPRRPEETETSIAPRFSPRQPEETETSWATGEPRRPEEAETSIATVEPRRPEEAETSWSRSRNERDPPQWYWRGVAGRTHWCQLGEASARDAAKTHRQQYWDALRNDPEALRGALEVLARFREEVRGATEIRWVCENCGCVNSRSRSYYGERAVANNAGDPVPEEDVWFNDDCDGCCRGVSDVREQPHLPPSRTGRTTWS